MISPDAEGMEVLATLALPLPINIVPQLIRAIAEAAVAAGYVDVVLLTDGSGRIAGRRPAERKP